MKPDGRRDPRYRISTKVALQVGRRNLALMTGDVGLRGMFVKTSEPLTQNEFVRLALTVPWTHERLVLLGRIAHLRKAQTGEMVGAGIELYANGRAELDVWENFVREAAQRHPEAATREVRLDGDLAPMQLDAPTQRRFESELHVRVSFGSLEELFTLANAELANGAMFVGTKVVLPLGEKISVAIVHPTTHDVFTFQATVKRGIADHARQGLLVELSWNDLMHARFRDFMTAVPKGTEAGAARRPPVVRALPPPLPTRQVL